MSSAEMSKTKVKMNLRVSAVNGVKVTSFVKVDGGCQILKHKDGLDGKYWKPNSAGDYEIAIKVNAPGNHTRLSAIIMY